MSTPSTSTLFSNRPEQRVLLTPLCFLLSTNKQPGSAKCKLQYDTKGQDREETWLCLKVRNRVGWTAAMDKDPTYQPKLGQDHVPGYIKSRTPFCQVVMPRTTPDFILVGQDLS
jgi:hypothetical protein